MRFLIFRQGPDRAKVEHASSDDGRVTWETNWIAVDRRIKHRSRGGFRVTADARR